MELSQQGEAGKLTDPVDIRGGGGLRRLVVEGEGVMREVGGATGEGGDNSIRHRFDGCRLGEQEGELSTGG